MQTPEKNDYAMKTKIANKKEWRRIFKILPVTTEDGYKVLLTHVWVRQVDAMWEDVNEYHTNPDGREDFFQSEQLDAIQLPPLKMTEQIREWGSSPMPPVKRPKRPPPPPAPPPRDPSGMASTAIGYNTGDNSICLICGTTGCNDGQTKIKVSGAGVLSTTSEDIMNSCNVRRQMRALKQIKIGKRSTNSTGPR